MNRLQKKCLVATAGLHLLLVLVILFGSAFFISHSKPDETQVLNVIPANLVDAAFNSGVKNAQVPAPTPIAKPPEPTPPKPVVTPPTPQPKPEPVKPPEPEPVKPQKLSLDDLKPLEPAKTEPKKIEISLKPVVHNVPKATTDTSAADAAHAAAKAAKKRADAFASAARSIKKNASSATTVEMPGTGSVSYANYASVVKSIYEQAWTPPDDTASDDANTKVSVTIGRDGSVIASRILNPSGDSRVDNSVRRTLDRVTFVAPFPEGAKEKERTFIINFNLKAKRLLG